MLLLTGVARILFVSSPIYWVRPSIEIPVLRGESSPAVNAFYEPSRMDALADELRQAIETAYARASGAEPTASFYGWRTRFIMAARLQVCPRGEVRVSVRTYDRAEDALLQDWHTDLLNADRASHELVRFAELIGEDLSELRDCL